MNDQYSFKKQGRNKRAEVAYGISRLSSWMVILL